MGIVIRRLLLIFTLLVAAPAFAAPAWMQYSPAEFTKSQSAGKTIIVDVHADWCPTCRAQAPILDTLRQDPRFKNAMFIRVDFDKDKAFLRQHRIARQSTILVFKGRKETARSVAETRAEKLRALLTKGTR